MSKTLVNIVLIMVAVILLPAFILALVTCTACVGTVALVGVAAAEVDGINTRSPERQAAAAAMMADLDAEVLAKDAPAVTVPTFPGYCRACQSDQQFRTVGIADGFVENGMYQCLGCDAPTRLKPMPDAGD